MRQREKRPTSVAGFGDGEEGSLAKECGWLLEAGKDKRMDSPQHLQKECSPADTFSSVGVFQTSDP